MRNHRINHYLNTLERFFANRRGNKPLKWLSGTILIVTVYFGATPFNFISRNDLQFDPISRGLYFHATSLEGESSRRGIAYTNDSLRLEKSQPISIFLELTSERKPDGLGTLIELHDGQRQAPLIIAQWQSHLAIRSRRIASSSDRPYSEIGLRDCIEPGKTVSLLISSANNETLIYLNGKLALRRPGFSLIDPNNSTRAQIIVGNNAFGERYWIGRLNRLSVFDKQVDPLEIETEESYPLIEYAFKETDSLAIPNIHSKAFALQTPTAFAPLVRKRFAPLSSWSSSQAGQYRDALLNVFGFIPIGLVLYAFIGQRSQSRTLRFVSVVLASFALSFAIEYAQVYLPSRSPSQLDLLGNTLGGSIAAIICSTIRKPKARRV